MAKPFKSSKYIKAADTWIGTRGKMIFLLKAKAKASRAQENKKTYEIVRHMLPHEHAAYINPAFKKAIEEKKVGEDDMEGVINTKTTPKPWLMNIAVISLKLTKLAHKSHSSQLCSHMVCTSFLVIVLKAC